MTDIDITAAVEAVEALDWSHLEFGEMPSTEQILRTALPHILAQVPGYIPPTDPKPGTRWEYGIMRPASPPDMSGRPRWTLIVGATFASKEQAENARRRVPSLLGDPAVICRRLVSDWEETK